MHYAPHSILLGRLYALLCDGHGLYPDDETVLRLHVHDVVGLGLLPSGQSPDVFARKAVADEDGFGVVAVHGVDLEFYLDMHLGEIARELLNSDLCGPADKCRGIRCRRLADLGLVEHAGCMYLVPLFCLPLILDLAGRAFRFLCCHQDPPLRYTAGFRGRIKCFVRTAAHRPPFRKG